MSWIQCKINPEKTEKEAEITIGDARLSFGVSACRLLNNPFNNIAVEFYKNTEDPDIIGVRFLSTAEPASAQSAYLIRNKSDVTSKDGQVISFSVTGKEILSKIFGDIALSPRSYKCKTRVSRDIENMLEIDLSTKRIAKPGLVAAGNEVAL